MSPKPLPSGTRAHDPTPSVPTTSPFPGAGSSVWPVAQRSLARQRHGRYVPASARHPGRMAPDLAAYAIHTYTKAGDLVLDPMCGIGTTLVEAAHAARPAYGIEYEPVWAEIARDNAELARIRGARTRIEVRTGDAQNLSQLIPSDLIGEVALILTSPPYGPRAHARVATTRVTGIPGVQRSYDTYENNPHDPANLVNADHDGLIAGIARILNECTRFLRSDGTVVLTVRPWRRHGELVDLPTMIAEAAERAGLTQTDRRVALLAGIDSDRLIARPSFHQLLHLRRARSKGSPVQLIAHEDVLIFSQPEKSTGSEKSKGFRGEGHE
jgi:modification methylase